MTNLQLPATDHPVLSLPVTPGAEAALADPAALAVETCLERPLGLRTTHERQRQLRQKALGWN
jgi:hypothetical protein